MGNVSGNLSALAKELANAQKKAQKLDAKGSNKAEGAQSNVDAATTQWESQAPFVFEQLQALDEGRVNHLRDVLTQFQTHELDAVERGRASAESCLNALLNVETADEIKTFTTRARGQTPTLTSRRDSVPAPSRTAAGPPAPPPPRNANLEQRNSSMSQEDRLTPCKFDPVPCLYTLIVLVPEPPKEKKLSGLKRLGTVMGRRKNAAPPPVPTEKKKERTRSFVPFRRQESSRSFSDLETTGQDLSPVTSRDGRTSSRHDSERPPQTQESRTRETLSPPALNGTTTRTSDSDAPLSQVPALQPRMTEPPAIADPFPTSDNYRTSQPDPFAQAGPETSAEDSARAFEIKDQPIAEDAGAAQLAMSNIQNQLRMQAQSSGLNRNQTSVRGRRDVRNTMFFPSQQAELPSPGETSTNIGSPSTPLSSVTGPTTATSITPATTSADTSSDVVTPLKRSLGTGTIPEDSIQSPSDTYSVHSSHSMAALPYHIEMHAPGLNASLVETVNTWFSDAGVTRSFVVGEVGLAYNRSGSAQSNQEMVRLQNFHQLEKCAQNPQFVTAASGDHQPGTYNIALSSISRSIPTVAFKYQLHLEESALSMSSPLIITQAWQVVEGQASVILLYSLNPAFAPIANPGSSPTPPPQELTLKNVSITVNLDVKPNAGSEPSPRAVQAQMMPVQNAQFKKRSSAVVWKWPELTLKPTQERLLVRFMVENNGVARRGGVDAKFEVHDMLGSALGVERLVVAEEAGHAADPFADADADEAEARRSAEAASRWVDVQSRKILVSGKYSAT